MTNKILHCMKKIILLLPISMITSFGFSQCITTEDANNTVSFCKYSGAVGKEDFSTSNIIAAAAQKWMRLMVNAVVDPAIKKTKGLRGTWNGTLEIGSDDGLSPYNLQCTMLELGCTKTKKLYEKDESGLIFTFHINSLRGIANAITKMPLKLCTMVGCIVQPNILVSVWLFAIKVREEPACSKAPQKNITKKQTIYNTQILSRSTLVIVLSERIR